MTLTFGQWFELTDFENEADFYAACQALHADEADPELMFQDQEGIPDGMASESGIDWRFIAAYRQAKDDGQEAAFVAWAEYTGESDYEAFEEAYCGEADDEEAYAMSLAEDCGLLSGMPDNLRGYFDYAAFARDLFCSDYYFCEGYVFRHL